MSGLGKFEDDEFQAFVKNFDKYIKDDLILKELEEEFQRVTNIAIRIVKKNTPVGKSITYTGLKLQGNNLFETTMKTKGHGNLRRSWHTGKTERSGSNIMVEIYNDAEYAIFVEKGHRQQVGRYVPVLGKRLKNVWVEGVHMLEKSLDPIEKAMSDIMTKAFENALEKLIGG